MSRPLVKAVLIDPGARTVRDLPIPRDDPAEWNHLIGCDLMHIGRAPIPGVMFAVDDGGLLKPNACFVLLGYAQPLAGKALLVGCDQWGETIDCPLDADGAAALVVAWVPQETALAQVRTDIALGAAEARAYGLEVKTSPDGLCNVISARRGHGQR